MRDGKPYHLQGALRLRKWRARAELTQNEMSVQVGVDMPRYNAYENGRARPGLEHAVRIAEITGGAVPVASWTIEVSADEWAKAS